MEARQTLRGSAVPKGLMVVLAVCAAVGLAVGAAVVSTELAAKMGMGRLPFKQRVRRLKELGLTESLEVGYRLSPRGEAFVAAL